MTDESQRNEVLKTSPVENGNISRLVFNPKESPTETANVIRLTAGETKVSSNDDEKILRIKGEDYFNQEKFGNAAETFKELQARQTDKYGPESEQVCWTLYYRGSALMNDKNFDEAISCLKEHESLIEKHYGNTEYPAIALSKLGQAYSQGHKPIEAIQCYKKSLDISAKIFGPDHKTVAGSYNNIAGVYFDNNNFASAQANYEKALSIYSKYVSSNDSIIPAKSTRMPAEEVKEIAEATFHTLKDYAELLKREGYGNEAQRQETSAQKIKDRYLTIKHPQKFS